MTSKNESVEFVKKVLIDKAEIKYLAYTNALDDFYEILKKPYIAASIFQYQLIQTIISLRASAHEWRNIDEEIIWNSGDLEDMLSNQNWDGFFCLNALTEKSKDYIESINNPQFLEQLNGIKDWNKQAEYRCKLTERLKESPLGKKFIIDSIAKEKREVHWKKMGSTDRSDIIRLISYRFLFDSTISYHSPPKFLTKDNQGIKVISQYGLKYFDNIKPALKALALWAITEVKPNVSKYDIFTREFKEIHIKDYYYEVIEEYYKKVIGINPNNDPDSDIDPDIDPNPEIEPYMEQYMAAIEADSPIKPIVKDFNRWIKLYKKDLLHFNLHSDIFRKLFTLTTGIIIIDKFMKYPDLKYKDVLELVKYTLYLKYPLKIYFESWNPHLVHAYENAYNSRFVKGNISAKGLHVISEALGALANALNIGLYVYDMFTEMGDLASSLETGNAWQIFGHSSKILGLSLGLTCTIAVPLGKAGIISGSLAKISMGMSLGIFTISSLLIIAGAFLIYNGRDSIINEWFKYNRFSKNWKLAGMKKNNEVYSSNNDPSSSFYRWMMGDDYKKYKLCHSQVSPNYARQSSRLLSLIFPTKVSTLLVSKNSNDHHFYRIKIKSTKISFPESLIVIRAILKNSDKNKTDGQFPPEIVLFETPNLDVQEDMEESDYNKIIKTIEFKEAPMEVPIIEEISMDIDLNDYSEQITNIGYIEYIEVVHSCTGFNLPNVKKQKPNDDNLVDFIDNSGCVFRTIREFNQNKKRWEILDENLKIKKWIDIDIKLCMQYGCAEQQDGKIVYSKPFCVNKCKVYGLLSTNEGDKIIVDLKKCNKCNNCESICDAIRNHYAWGVEANIYSHSLYNKDEILSSEICGCYKCGGIFKYKEIEPENIKFDENTFKCPNPHCRKVSVIGDYSGYKILSSLLTDVKNWEEMIKPQRPPYYHYP